jgi:transcriptional regulator with GAF, ATPase, and Fis domain
METWDEMKARHKRERIELVETLAQSRLTQTQAAKMLKVELTALNNFIRRNRIFWPVIEQGKRTNETHASR